MDETSDLQDEESLMLKMAVTLRPNRSSDSSASWLSQLWMVVTFAVGLMAAGAFGGQYNPSREIGDTVSSWENLAGVDGKRHSWSEYANVDFLVVVFTCNSCPYAVDYEERINAFAKRWERAEDRVRLIAINSNTIPEDSLKAMQRRAKEQQFVFPYLFDESQEVARSFGAVRTPEFFVLDKQRRIRYMGGMDDASEPAKVKARYLEDALDALLAGQSIQVAETPPVGCMIRSQRRRRQSRATGE
jgi:peroxiredoxin